MPRERLLDLLSIRYCIGGDLNRDIFYGGAPRKVTLIERPTYNPRAITADLKSVHPCSGFDQALKLILDSPSYDVSRNATVELSEEQWKKLCAGIPAPALQSSDLSLPAGRMDAIQQGWNRIDLKVEVNRPGLLVLNESWYKGWKVFVDGQEKPIFIANAAFMGVVVEPGEQIISFEYDPLSFKTGYMITLFSIGICCVLLAIGFKARKNRHQSSHV